VAKDCSGPRSGWTDNREARHDRTPNCGNATRRAKPAAASPEYAAVSRLRTVRSLTPVAAATAADRSRWVRIPRHDLPRLQGVVRAFLWMFIRAAFSGAWQAETRMANLLTVHT